MALTIRVRASRRLALAGALSLLAVVPRAAIAAPTPAQVEEAKVHYARGVELYRSHQDEAALAELERAYALAHNYRILYNIGLVDLQVGDFAGALVAFERFLSEGTDIAAARRTEVEAKITQLKTRVATLTVTSTPPDAAVTLDDVPIGNAPLEKRVNPGRYRLRASRAGYEARAIEVSVAGDDHVQVPIELQPLAPPRQAEVAPEPLPPPAPTPTPEPLRAQPSPLPAPPPPPSTSYVWVGWAATGVLAAAAITTGALALSAKGDLSSAKSDGPTSREELDRLGGRAQGFALASDITAVAAVAVGATTLWITLKPPARSAGSAGGSMTFAVSPNGAQFRGSF